MTLLPAHLGADSDPDYLQYFGERKIGTKRIPLAIRQINSGAIKYVNRNKWIGKDWEPPIDVSNINGRHEVFFRPEFGLRAQTKLIQKRIREGRNTLGKITSKYAPAAYDGNDPSAYAHWLSKRLDWDPNAVFQNQPEHVAPLIAAMTDYESGWHGFWSKRQIEMGVNMAYDVIPRHAYPEEEYERPTGQVQVRLPKAQVPIGAKRPTPPKPDIKPHFEPEPKPSGPLAKVLPDGIRKRANKAQAAGTVIAGGIGVSKWQWVKEQMFSDYWYFLGTLGVVFLFTALLVNSFLYMRRMNLEHERIHLENARND